MVDLILLTVCTAIGAFVGTSWAIRRGEKRQERLIAEQEADWRKSAVSRTVRGAWKNPPTQR